MLGHIYVFCLHGMPHFLLQFPKVCENLITLEQVRFHQNTVQISVDFTFFFSTVSPNEY